MPQSDPTRLTSPSKGPKSPQIAAFLALTNRSPSFARLERVRRRDTSMELGKNTPVARAVCALACAVAGILIAAPAASARLAVIATGKTRVSVVDLSRNQTVARPRVGLQTRAVALSSD